MSSVTVAQLKTYIDADYNVLIQGPAGTGKTAMLKEACKELGLRMKYYSASTLDPFADLVGIPVPDKETKRVEYYRPRDVDEADVVFCDELNRADSKTLNALFEMIQFKTINGEPLPKLKCVVAAINPVEDGYNTEELDIALLDRFDIYLETTPKFDVPYFKSKYGADYARAGAEIFREYQESYKQGARSKNNKLGYLSPRRMDKLMEIYQKFPTPKTVSSVLPSDVLISPRQCSQTLTDALNGIQRNEADRYVELTDEKDPLSIYNEQLDLKPEEMRRKANAADFNIAYAAFANSPASAGPLLTKLAEALSTGVGPKTIERLWKKPVKDMTPSLLDTMTQSWSSQKYSEFWSLYNQW